MFRYYYFFMYKNLHNMTILAIHDRYLKNVIHCVCICIRMGISFDIVSKTSFMTPYDVIKIERLCDMIPDHIYFWSSYL